VKPHALASILFAGFVCQSSAAAQQLTEYRVLATSKTSTMQKEMQDAAAAGFKFAAVMGGETSFGGKEVVVLMQKTAESTDRFEYRLLATSKTSTMEKEIQEAAKGGFDYIGQTVFETAFGGNEVSVILERDLSSSGRRRFEYKLIATSKTSTLQKELQGIGSQGYEALGMTVGQTAIGGSEVVVILRRPLR